jgi:hypothetical protein
MTKRKHRTRASVDEGSKDLSSMLPGSNDTKVRLSLAYVRAVAARCGCFVTAEEGADLASIDCTLFSALQPRRMLSIQLKATTKPVSTSGPIIFDLPVKNYNDLRRTDTTAPQLLIVMYLPNDPQDWLISDHANLILRQAAWWKDLWGAPDTENTSTERVSLPRERSFDCNDLTRVLDIMARIATGQEKRRPLHEM